MQVETRVVLKSYKLGWLTNIKAKNVILHLTILKDLKREVRTLKISIIVMI